MEFVFSFFSRPRDEHTKVLLFENEEGNVLWGGFIPFPDSSATLLGNTLLTLDQVGPKVLRVIHGYIVDQGLENTDCRLTIECPNTTYANYLGEGEWPYEYARVCKSILLDTWSGLPFPVSLTVEKYPEARTYRSYHKIIDDSKPEVESVSSLLEEFDDDEDLY